MTGQDAIKSANEFNARRRTVVLTSWTAMRGGAALSVVSVVGVPIAFAGGGGCLEDLEPFHPERVVSRVLGMGDVLSLIEKASGDHAGRRRTAGEDPVERFTLGLSGSANDPEDGPLDRSWMLPGIATSRHSRRTTGREADFAMRRSSRDGAGRRRKTTIINGSRRKRIAKGVARRSRT
jgi:signal recognition particle subunit SRP54